MLVINYKINTNKKTKTIFFWFWRKEKLFYIQ